MNFDKLSDVDRYVAELGKTKLRLLLADEVIHPANLQVALRWFAVRAQIEAEEAAIEAHANQVRLTVAAETSAKAADRSERWALFAVITAVAALAVSAWPHINA